MSTYEKRRARSLKAQEDAEALCNFYTRDELREVATARFGHKPTGYRTKAELAYDLALMGVRAPLRGAS